ncbi:hypothetical protein [Roseovarius sp.]|uniref:hypothetical protein n=1 Tax=Roseovarius sp. TaxID=1486281 RepID=UPI003BAD27F9
MRPPDFDDPDLPLSELFVMWPMTATAFLARRMLCPGCPIAPFHAITDACLEYGLDEDAFRAELAGLIGEAGAGRRRA